MIITAESVTGGHPDKLCDQLSDALLDAYLARDPLAKVACECFITTDYVVVGGEVSSENPLSKKEREAIIRSVLCAQGYDDPSTGFDGNSCEINDRIHEQSPEIRQGVVDGGAGDQGSMFGYACRETESLMPFPIWRSHRLAERLEYVRKHNIVPFFYPDGKVQLSVEYGNDYRGEGAGAGVGVGVGLGHGSQGLIQPMRIDTVVVSTQHHAGVTQEEIRLALMEHVIVPTVGNFIDDTTSILINPTGSFIIGGPHGDCGLTGRKIIVDTYGGAGKHGGGAFSGKDPSKVDRSGAYMARRIAKNIVARGRADRCEIQLSYAIGVAQPVGMYGEFFGTNTIPVKEIEERLYQVDCTPFGIIDRFGLRRPLYLPTATYGHFGRALFPWEQVELSVE